MKIRLTNNSGLIKEADWGFSWKTLLFGLFVPLVRGDLAWFFIGFFLSICTAGIALLVFPFYYNKIYVKKLLVQGFYPLDEESRKVLVGAGIIRDQVESTRTELKVPQPASIPPAPMRASTPVQPEGWVCNHCGTENGASHHFCYSCGHEREEPKPTCPGCGAPMEGKMKYCPACGMPLRDQEDAETTGKSAAEISEEKPLAAVPASADMLVTKHSTFPADKVIVFLALLAGLVLGGFISTKWDISGLLLKVGFPSQKGRSFPIEETYSMWGDAVPVEREIYDQGGTILKIISIKGDAIRFKYTVISEPPANRIAEIETIAIIQKRKGDTWEASFSFENDGWGNGGKGKIFYNGFDQIRIDVENTKIDETAMWNLSGNLILHGMDN